MYNVLVHGDGFHWEKDGRMSIDRGRFKEYSESEADAISLDRPETFASLENAHSLRMYETGADGPNTGIVRVGNVYSIRVGRGDVSFRFKQSGRAPRKAILEHSRLLNLHQFESSRTHWAIKDGTLPDLIRELIEPVVERYDIALSFAGEDREYVEAVALNLKDVGVSVFYDRFEDVELWGNDLAETFDRVYRTGAQFCVMFISSHYARNIWTNHERRSAIAAAIAARKEYILPARFDGTEVPGIQPTIGYVDLNVKTPKEFSDLIVQKLRQ